MMSGVEPIDYNVVVQRIDHPCTDKRSIYCALHDPSIIVESLSIFLRSIIVFKEFDRASKA